MGKSYMVYLHRQLNRMDDFSERLKKTGSYQEALTLMQEYVEFE